MVSGRVDGTSIFFPHASGADLTPVASLEALGAEVTSVAVYGTKSVAPGLEAVDAALFGSPSAVTGWGMSRSFDQVILAALGETTGRALAELGHPPDVVPSRPDFDLLIALVAHHLIERSHR
jgi:uroporphyrinogen-III synthase